MKKKFAVCLVVLSIFLSFGIANAIQIESSMVPEELSNAFEEAFPGVQQGWAVWIPAVPEIPSNFWTNIVVVSNWTSGMVQVACEFTSFSKTQTIKVFTLEGFEKVFVTIPQEIGTNDVFDVFCTANTIMGAIDLLINSQTGEVMTVIPPIVFSF